MRSLAVVLASLLTLQGCFISLDFDKFDDDDDWEDTDEPRDDSGAPEVPDDSDEPTDDTEVVEQGPDVTVVVHPGTVAPGETTFVDVVLSGDAGSDDLVDLVFGEGVEVLDWRVLDEVTVLVAIDVAVDVSGAIDLDLDFGDLGGVHLDDVLIVAADDAGVGGGGTGGEEPCEE
jgi:hypothetical protein